MYEYTSDQDIEGGILGPEALLDKLHLQDASDCIQSEDVVIMFLQKEKAVVKDSLVHFTSHCLAEDAHAFENPGFFQAVELTGEGHPVAPVVSEGSSGISVTADSQVQRAVA